MNRKVKYFKQCFYRNSMRCKKLQSVRSAVFRPWHRLTIVLLLVHCPVDNTLFAVRVCKVATMETTQLVLSLFKNALSHQWRIE